MNGDVASSSTFCCRRCALHSRSPQWITLPSPSPKTCTSMCSALGMNFSTKTPAFEKSVCAQREEREL